MNNIKKLREAKGLSQDELAALLGYSAPNRRSIIYKWETSKKTPPVKQISKLCEILGCKFEDLGL